MTKTAITPADVQVHLNEQLGFLERSVAAFDQGYEDEAKRLAVTLRVLLHDTTHCWDSLGVGKVRSLILPCLQMRRTS
jgi:hypothetical protein